MQKLCIKLLALINIALNVFQVFCIDYNFFLSDILPIPKFMVGCSYRHMEPLTRRKISSLQTMRQDGLIIFQHLAVLNDENVPKKNKKLNAK